MTIHNATKLLPLTSQTKLTIIVTLTLTDTVTLIFMHTSLTPLKRFYCIYKKEFFAVVHSRVCGGIFLYYAAIALAVFSSENDSDKKSIVHTLSLKVGFCGVYVRKRG